MKELMANFQAFIEKISPAKRRLAVMLIAVGLIIVISTATMLVGNQVVGEKKTRRIAQAVEFYPLTGKDTSKLQGEVTADRLRQLESELSKLKNGETIPGQSKPAAVNPVFPAGSQPNGPPDPLATVTLGQVVKGGDVLPGQIFAPGIVPPPIRKKTEQSDVSVKAVEQPTNSDPLFPSPVDSKNKKGFGDKKPKPGGPSTTAKSDQNRDPNPDPNVDFDSGVGPDGLMEGPPAKKLQIREIVDEQSAKAGDKGGLGGVFAGVKGNLQEQGLFMPSGSIISGVLITGMDAPTANQSRKDPFPVLLRVKDETLLPNRMKMDIRECFIIASGYGDMSSERAYLRAETVSCVREDGGVIETGINAYAVGEDGKNGARGRLVSKTGQLVARSLMAGFLAGMADVLKPQKVQTVNLASGATDQQQGFLSIDPAQALGQGALGGVNNSMNKIADYYIEMARSIFPIIEIEAGRKIDFIMIRGAKLALQSGSKNSQKSGKGQSGHSSAIGKREQL